MITEHDVHCHVHNHAGLKKSPWNIPHFVRFQVLTAVNMKMTALLMHHPDDGGSTHL
jgi:hypothetical protein